MNDLRYMLIQFAILVLAATVVAMWVNHGMLAAIAMFFICCIVVVIGNAIMRIYDRHIDREDKHRK